MMKYFIVYVYFNSESLNYLILDIIVNMLKKNGYEVIVWDLYEFNF